MNSYLPLPFAIVFHAGLLTCEKPAPNISKSQAPDTTEISLEQSPNDEFYDNMPNAFEGMEMITVPNDFIPTDVDVEPQFPGGQPAFQRYINKYLEIPDAVRRLRINGKVYTSFIITDTGEIDEVMVVKSLQLNCDQAALTLFRYMPKWKPAIKDGNPVGVRHYLEIPFDYRAH